MKILQSVLGVFLFGICPIFSYYANDDSPKAGYVSVQNSGRSNERRGLRGMQRRHFAGGTHKHKNENIVDSHFKVKKTPPYHLPYKSAENSRREVQVRQWITEAPIHQQTKPDQEIVEHVGRQQEMVARANQIHRSPSENQDTQQLFNVQRSRPVNAEYRDQTPQRSQNLQMHNYHDIHENRYETKPNFVKMNVHKTQISTDPQKVVRKNNNQQITSISMHRPDEKYQKPASAAVDKTLQKVPTYSERNSKIMSRALDEMVHKRSDSKFKGEYRKRDAEFNDRSYDMDKVNRNHISDTMRKYIVGKDKTINTERKHTKEFSRIGSHEDSIEPEESPYAIFYRMHPDTLDEQEGFISMGSMEENTNLFTNKKKRLSVSYENEVDVKKTKKRPKNNSNAVKIHKKVKNFSNYRTL